MAELDQVAAALRDAGSDRWAEAAEETAGWVRDVGVDSVVMARLRLYRKVLAAAAAGSP
jgi:hypothetical protein